MKDVLERLEEEMSVVNDKIKEYEKKSYSIFSSSAMINDKVEYDRLLGEKRGLEFSIINIKQCN